MVFRLAPEAPAPAEKLEAVQMPNIHAPDGQLWPAVETEAPVPVGGACPSPTLEMMDAPVGELVALFQSGSHAETGQWKPALVFGLQVLAVGTRQPLVSGMPLPVGDLDPVLASKVHIPFGRLVSVLGLEDSGPGQNIALGSVACVPVGEVVGTLVVWCSVVLTRVRELGLLPVFGAHALVGVSAALLSRISALVDGLSLAQDRSEVCLAEDLEKTVPPESPGHPVYFLSALTLEVPGPAHSSFLELFPATLLRGPPPVFPSALPGSVSNLSIPLSLGYAVELASPVLGASALVGW